jgi:integrase/recombinase XerD
MKLHESLDTYIQLKRANGAAFENGARSLRSFFNHTGDLALTTIRERHVTTFLDGPFTQTAAWRAKYFLLRGFFLYWIARKEIPALPMPKIRPAVRQTFVPYIYSRGELRCLLSALRATQKPSCKIEAKTFRVLLLFLYGTGALVGEALRLRRNDIDFKRRRVTLRSGRFNRRREIPLGADLYKILRIYCDIKHREASGLNLHFFLDRGGDKLNVVTLNQNFQKLRTFAGVARHDGARYQPRLHDLRHTFAVHRITAWLKEGADLGRMIPALSVYIGQVGLASTERYLSLTPERFRKQLNKLSPKRGRRKWRDDPALMRFVDGLSNGSTSLRGITDRSLHDGAKVAIR